MPSREAIAYRRGLREAIRKRHGRQFADYVDATLKDMQRMSESGTGPKFEKWPGWPRMRAKPGIDPLAMVEVDESVPSARRSSRLRVVQFCDRWFVIPKEDENEGA